MSDGPSDDALPPVMRGLEGLHPQEGHQRPQVLDAVLDGGPWMEQTIDITRNITESHRYICIL